MSSDKVKFTKEVKEKWEQVLKDDDPLNWIVLEFGTDKHKNRVRVFLLKISNPNVIQDPHSLFLSHFLNLWISRRFQVIPFQKDS